MTPICPFCLRPISEDAPQSHHRPVPRAQGGKGCPTVLLHPVCHKESHATPSETELARKLTTVDALRAHPRLTTFLQWVAKRPPVILSRCQNGKNNAFHDSRKILRGIFHGFSQNPPAP